MRNLHQIAIAFRYIIPAGHPFLAATPSDESCLSRAAEGLRNADGAPHAWKVATTSEPPGPGSPSIPGGPGPLPDDDDDEDAALSA